MQTINFIFIVAPDQQTATKWLLVSLSCFFLFSVSFSFTLVLSAGRSVAQWNVIIGAKYHFMNISYIFPARFPYLHQSLNNGSQTSIGYANKTVQNKHFNIKINDWSIVKFAERICRLYIHNCVLGQSFLRLQWKWWFIRS